MEREALKVLLRDSGVVGAGGVGLRGDVIAGGGVADGETILHHMGIGFQGFQRHLMALGDVHIGLYTFKSRTGRNGAQGNRNIVNRMDLNKVGHIVSS